MNRPALILIILWAMAPSLTAQITVTNAVFPAVGDTLHYLFGNQPDAINQIFTPPGFGQQWNLSNLQPNQTWKQVMQSPQAGSANASFPGATIMYQPPNSNNEVYLQVTGDQVLDMGYAGLDPLGLGLDLLFQNKPGFQVSWAPVNFFDLKASNSNILTAFSAGSAPPILLNLVPTADSFRIRVTMQSISSIDATGTLSIPGGTFDVLRKKQTLYRSIALDVKVQPLGWIDISTIGGQQILPLGTDTLTTFHFLNDLSKETIAICSLNTAQNTVTGVQYKDLSLPTSTEWTDRKVDFSVFPNPVHHTLYVQIKTDDASGMRLRLVDIQGRIVLEQAAAGFGKEKDNMLPIAHLPSGFYTLILERNGLIIGKERVVKP